MNFIRRLFNDDPQDYQRGKISETRKDTLIRRPSGWVSAQNSAGVLIYARPDQVPANAVRCRPEDLEKILYTRARRLPVRYTWPFSLGLPYNAICSGICGMLITAHFRKHFLLHRYSYVVPYVAGFFLPATLTSAAMYTIVALPILSLGYKPIHLAYGTAIQLFGAVVYPVCTGVLFAMIGAKRHVTFAVPPASDLKANTKMLQHACAAGKRNLLLISAVQLITAPILVWSMNYCVRNRLLPLSSEEVIRMNEANFRNVRPVSRT